MGHYPFNYQKLDSFGINFAYSLQPLGKFLIKKPPTLLKDDRRERQKQRIQNGKGKLTTAEEVEAIAASSILRGEIFELYLF